MDTNRDLRTLILEGVNLLDAGDKPRALAHFVIATQLQPNDEKLWLLRAEAANDPTEAVDCLEHALEINPENKEAREKLVFLRLGNLQEEARGITQSASQEQNANSLSPGVPLNRFKVLVVAFALVFCMLSTATLGAFAFVSQSMARSNEIAVDKILATTTQPMVAMPPTWTPQPTATPLPPFTVAPPPTWRIIRDAAVKAGPATNYDTLGTLKSDQRISVVGHTKDGKYLQIEYPEPGKLAWISVANVEISNADQAALAIVTAIPNSPTPGQKVAAAPTAKVTNTPAALFEFEATQPIRLLADCNRQTGIFGTIYAGKSNGQPVNGVLVRVNAFGQTQGIIPSGVKNQAGYWEWHFANGADISGEVMLVNSDGSPRSLPTSFRLTRCNGGTNMANIDFVGTR